MREVGGKFWFENVFGTNKISGHQYQFLFTHKFNHFTHTIFIFHKIYSFLLITYLNIHIILNYNRE